MGHSGVCRRRGFISNKYKQKRWLSFWTSWFLKINTDKYRYYYDLPIYIFFHHQMKSFHLHTSFFSKLDRPNWKDPNWSLAVVGLLCPGLCHSSNLDGTLKKTDDHVTSFPSPKSEGFLCALLPGLTLGLSYELGPAFWRQSAEMKGGRDKVSQQDWEELEEWGVMTACESRCWAAVCTTWCARWPGHQHLAGAVKVDLLKLQQSRSADHGTSAMY